MFLWEAALVPGCSESKLGNFFGFWVSCHEGKWRIPWEKGPYIGHKTHSRFILYVAYIFY